jgi:Niemann-Pick C1 protein
MDPHIVMGGFPVGPQFRNYSADATALVMTYPVDSRPEARARALAWEAAFVELAKGKLSTMAAAANLTLSFSSERSVQVGCTRKGGGQLWCRWHLGGCEQAMLV